LWAGTIHHQAGAFKEFLFVKANSQRKSTAVAHSSESFLSPAFLRKARKELEKIGFISDEHDFAPYGEVLSEHFREIERELRKVGFGGHLAPGFITNHPTAGYAYYVYDTNRFRDRSEAQAAVSRWLDRKYQGEP
jgi:hypothetical protein